MKEKKTCISPSKLLNLNSHKSIAEPKENHDSKEHNNSSSLRHDKNFCHQVSVFST